MLGRKRGCRGGGGCGSSNAPVLSAAARGLQGGGAVDGAGRRGGRSWEEEMGNGEGWWSATRLCFFFLASGAHGSARCNGDALDRLQHVSCSNRCLV